MNSVPDIKLPNELLPFKENIKNTIKPFVEIKAKAEKNLGLWQSKFGGFPYLPKGFQYPNDTKGQAMFLLAQINFAEAPKIKAFPETGILQFFISGGDDIYGVDFDDPTQQENFKVLYFPDILEDEGKLITDFRFLPKSGYLPLQKSCSLTFKLQYAPIPAGDYQFESKVPGQNVFKSKDEFYKILDEYEKLFRSSGHKIGGYPYFTQYDPRDNKKYKDEKYVLLFQMDTDNKAGIMWGDSGVGNFFIPEPDLEKKDFSRVLYNWDCC